MQCEQTETKGAAHKPASGRTKENAPPRLRRPKLRDKREVIPRGGGDGFLGGAFCVDLKAPDTEPTLSLLEFCGASSNTCDPGQPLTSSNMSESAEFLAANQTSRRNVTIEITNITGQYYLLAPKVYLESGNCHSPPQPTVLQNKTEVCNFSKTTAATSGAVGVMTYDVYRSGASAPLETLAIMFSVPFDYNLYKNWAAVGMYPYGTACDEKLYKEMYYNKKQDSFTRQETNGSCFTFEGQNLEIMCTMSPVGRAIMKVEVWDKSLFQVQQNTF